MYVIRGKRGRDFDVVLPYLGKNLYGARNIGESLYGDMNTGGGPVWGHEHWG